MSEGQPTDLPRPDAASPAPAVRPDTVYGDAARAGLDLATRYGALINAIDAAFCIIEVLFNAQGQPEDYRFIETNAAFSAQTGLTDAIGRRMRDMVPTHETHWFDIYGRVALTGEAMRFSAGAHALGRLYDVEAFSLGPAELRMVGVIFKDVTERASTDQRLQESEARAQLAIDVAQLGTFRYDPQVDEVTVDERLSTQWGDDGERLNMPLDVMLERLHELDRPHVEAAMHMALDPARPAANGFQMDCRIVWPDGSEHWLAINAQAHFEQHHDGQRATSLIGTTLDITARKRQEARQTYLLALSDALRGVDDPNEAQYAAARLLGRLLQASRVHYSEVDGAIIDVKPGYARGVGHLMGRFPLADIRLDYFDVLRTGKTLVVPDVGGAITQHAHATPELANMTVGALIAVPYLKGGDLVAMLSVHQSKARLWSSDEIALAEATAERTWAAVERARAEAALLESEERLREADARKDEFLATLAHELRNPLATIYNGLHLLSLPQTHDDADRIESMLHRQVDHMVHLIDDLMEVSRISRGAIELKTQPLDFATLVRDTVDAARPTVERAGHSLSVSLPAGPLAVDGDVVRLTQIVSNLLNNAVRYTDAGGQIDLRAWRDDGHAWLVVRDNGIGIAPDKLAQIFAMFGQIDRRDLRSQSGLGIGLSLAQRLARMHGGDIQAYSDGVGRGSTFTVRLPLTQAPLSDIPGDGQATSPGIKRVLVVDDNRDAADATAMFLTTLGADVRVVYDGPAALATLRHWPADLMLIDIGMPGMDGHELARRICALPERPQGKLVALTGWGQQSDMDRTRQSGFDEHLVKPANAERLIALLQSLD
ncbi:MAG: ATP-binding protein [Rhodocyclaceae bacterium]